MTPFARKVYKIVSKIPIGEVRSYKWVAKAAGKPRAPRAVGQILRHNPYPLIIPCHRVVNANGKTGNYQLGANAKRSILELERQIKKKILSTK